MVTTQKPYYHLAYFKSFMGTVLFTLCISFQVAAPGVWLPRRGDVYLSVTMFGQTGTTRLVDSIFPLCLYENFRFEKVILHV